jgi:hypothetical protein
MEQRKKNQQKLKAIKSYLGCVKTGDMKTKAYNSMRHST